MGSEYRIERICAGRVLRDLQASAGAPAERGSRLSRVPGTLPSALAIGAGPIAEQPAGSTVSGRPT
jgi:hypothetical protein